MRKSSFCLILGGGIMNGRCEFCGRQLPRCVFCMGYGFVCGCGETEGLPPPVADEDECIKCPHKIICTSCGGLGYKVCDCFLKFTAPQDPDIK